MPDPPHGPWHVLPIRDLREHDESIDCPCRPRVEECGLVIIHNAWDRREIIEELTLRPWQESSDA